MPEKDDPGNPSTPQPRKYVSEFAPSQVKVENKQSYTPTPSFALSSDKSVPEAKITTDPSGEGPRGEYASFGRRSVASFLDGLILGIIGLVFVLFIFYLKYKLMKIGDEVSQGLSASIGGPTVK